MMITFTIFLDRGNDKVTINSYI